MAINQPELIKGIIKFNPNILQQIAITQKIYCDENQTARKISLLECLSLTEAGCEMLLSLLEFKQTIAKELNVYLLIRTYPHTDSPMIIESLLSNPSGILFLQKATSINPSLYRELMANEVINSKGKKIMEALGKLQSQTIRVSAGQGFFNDENSKTNAPPVKALDFSN